MGLWAPGGCGPGDARGWQQQRAAAAVACPSTPAPNAGAPWSVDRHLHAALRCAVPTWRQARGVQLQEGGYHDQQGIRAQAARVDLRRGRSTYACGPLASMRTCREAAATVCVASSAADQQTSAPSNRMASPGPGLAFFPFFSFFLKGFAVREPNYRAPPLICRAHLVQLALLQEDLEDHHQRAHGRQRVHQRPHVGRSL